MLELKHFSYSALVAFWSQPLFSRFFSLILEIFVLIVKWNEMLEKSLSTLNGHQTKLENDDTCVLHETDVG
jgi:hypothetical protein